MEAQTISYETAQRIKQTHLESIFKHEGGDGKGERLAPHKLAATQRASQTRYCELEDIMEDSLPEPRPG